MCVYFMLFQEVNSFVRKESKFSNLTSKPLHATYLLITIYESTLFAYSQKIVFLDGFY